MHLLPRNFALVVISTRARDAAAHVANLPLAVTALQHVLRLMARVKSWGAAGRECAGGGGVVKHFDVSVSDGGRLRVEVNEGVAGGGQNLEERRGEVECRCMRRRGG